MTTTLGLIVLCGAVVAAGGWLLLRGLVPAQPRLGDVLARLDDAPLARAEAPASAEAESRSARLGGWLHRRGWLPLGEGQRRMLELQGKTIAEYGADKLIMAGLGLVTPVIVGALLGSMLGWAAPVPVAAGIVGAVVGWFVPDLLLRRGAAVARAGAGEALFTFFDLVVLERMANLSATQAVTTAAAVSDAPLFDRVRTALSRARLQQQAPWDELRRLANRLNLPELGDIADVMQLDESGAALTETLRARVRELRDAHLTVSRIAAHEVSERMTVYMVLPAMIFGLIFLTPPLMRLVGLA
ncbi:hypothetical protein [Naumannella cuiyingiana]|uniref:Flp pilus assembly protein TadB n=1 Tax=Naumannella cuiyingiana TaxID=1347891 RepID=A0A7Z0D964_9ACTN|nr:hypothetical protein [Naumannella cuiyingiana]NYI71097.1 Flp pilus assembly protein TadB [Naumannella cuiyingiana]